MRAHKWYMSGRQITMNDIYSFDPNLHVELDEFTDIIGRNFKQPARAWATTTARSPTCGARSSGRRSTCSGPRGGLGNLANLANPSVPRRGGGSAPALTRAECRDCHRLPSRMAVIWCKRAGVLGPSCHSARTPSSPDVKSTPPGFGQARAAGAGDRREGVGRQVGHRHRRHTARSRPEHLFRALASIFAARISRRIASQWPRRGSKTSGYPQIVDHHRADCAPLMVFRTAGLWPAHES